jgi:hypothetical protein
MLASSGHRSGEVGDGRAGRKGLHGRSDGSSADAASDTDEGGHFGRRRRRYLESGDCLLSEESRVLVVEVVVGWLFPGSGDDCRLV